MNCRVHAALLALSLFGALLGCTASSTQRHGSLSKLSAVRSAHAAFCPEQVAQAASTRCNPNLITQFKAYGDWVSRPELPE